MADAIAGIHTFMVMSHPKPVTGYVRYYKQELDGMWRVHETVYQDFAKYIISPRGFHPQLEKHAEANWTNGLSKLSSSFQKFDIALRAASHELSRQGDSMKSATFRTRAVDSLGRLAGRWRTIATVASSIKS